MGRSVRQRPGSRMCVGAATEEWVVCSDIVTRFRWRAGVTRTGSRFSPGMATRKTKVSYWQASQDSGFSREHAIAASVETAGVAGSAFDTAAPARVLLLVTVAFAILVAGRERR